MLSTSWVENNKKRAEQFSKWAEKANNLEDNPIYRSVLQAAKEAEKANEQLSQVLMQLLK